ncbi:50S ribosomal protein L11 methyltransferase [Pontivivens ytuae]|uniref:Ribosomal protein L11 methyltransferase n=1 Tax=Pontivivens ytuae TaxID=2789856 RepID=A0A7S9QEQ5_9RHOB|nr:50S ribosomal protein L11 methyltransferase [Pontivivens ytuae]QPH55687.1 50S ribosomal protein L11 methyltransferase [Pontivivens ytuae]
MTTWTALTTLPGEAPGLALAEALEGLDPAPTGVGVFEVEDGSGLWEVGGYFTEKPNGVALALLAAAHGAQDFAVSKLDDRDWVAQVRRELAPVEAGRFVVHGSHDRGAAGPHRIALEIDAAMAFGTGHHQTTLGCLLSLDALIREGWRATNVADVGAGTGVLAMAAAKVFPARVIASDIDTVATETARANMRWNGLGDRVACVTAPGFRHGRLRAGAPYDLVFANILAGPLRRLAPQMTAHTAPGSVIILSGILNRQATGVERTYAGWGFRRMQRRVIGEWTTLTLRR